MDNSWGPVGHVYTGNQYQYSSHFQEAQLPPWWKDYILDYIDWSIACLCTSSLHIRILFQPVSEFSHTLWRETSQVIYQCHITSGSLELLNKECHVLQRESP